MSRRREKWRANARQKRPVVKEQEFCLVQGEMSLREYVSMLDVLKDSELSLHCRVSRKPLPGVANVLVEIKVKRHAEFLLTSSLEDGMLREFGKYFLENK